jgi:hypothetical protein
MSGVFLSNKEEERKMEMNNSGRESQKLLGLFLD